MLFLSDFRDFFAKLSEYVRFALPILNPENEGLILLISKSFGAKDFDDSSMEEEPTTRVF